MVTRQGFPQGGLRIGIKSGGCSGLSYVFAWEPGAKEGDHVFEGPEGSRVFIDPEELPVHRRDDARLRHEPRQQGIHFQQSAREEFMRMRDEF